MRRTRIDLGQQPSSSKAQKGIERKRERWVARNKNKPLNENPFLEAVKPTNENYGDLEEGENELRERLQNLEFGNFPGYFNYRNKAATATNSNDKSESKSENPENQGDEIPTRTEEQNNAPATNQVNTDPQQLNSGLSDERLKCLKSEWFAGKNVLDIGCNRGHITYAVARLFSPKYIIGIDIDPKMVHMANRDLHLHLEGPHGVLCQARERRLERAAKLCSEGGDTYIEDQNQYPISSYIANGPLLGSLDHNDKDQIYTSSNVGQEIGDLVEVAEEKTDAHGKEPKESNSKNRFPENIVFIEHNYVLSKDSLVDKQVAYFDTIICLSVTKWIHLNYCDPGLKRFFKRIYNHLKVGGLFVLEAQPFDNYGRRKKLSDRLRRNFYSIELKPEQFDAYLLGPQVGFKRIIYETIGEHQCHGFKRPLKVFLK